jgi:hypothetical protein
MGQPTSGASISNLDNTGFVLLAFEEVSYTEYIGVLRQTQRTEISQYLEERTSTETPLVVTSERGPGQCCSKDNWNPLESGAVVGDSPVQVMQCCSLE